MRPVYPAFAKADYIRDWEVALSRTMKIFFLALVVAIASPFVSEWFTQPKTDADKIRAAIQQIARGAEQADIQMCMEPFSNQYEDKEGMDKRNIQAILWNHFRKRGPIMVWLGDIDVAVENNAATAQFDVGLAEGEQGSAVPWPVSADVLSFYMDFVHEDGEWRVIDHTRKPAFNDRGGR